jgi:ribonuclease HI
VERIIIDLEGKEKNSFVWGLGEAVNNQSKVLALFQGLRIANDKQHKRLIVIGDSKLVIKSIH